jgi:hypothetical protein
MMYRMFKKLRTFVLQDRTGLCDAVAANWADFNPDTNTEWYSLENPQHY